MPCNYRAGRPIIEGLLASLPGFQYINDLEPVAFNAMYDQLEFSPPASSPDEEVRNKKNLLAWIVRNYASLKRPNVNMPAKALIDGSMKLREAATDARSGDSVPRPSLAMSDECLDVKIEHANNHDLKQAALSAPPAAPRCLSQGSKKPLVILPDSDVEDVGKNDGVTIPLPGPNSHQSIPRPRSETPFLASTSGSQWSSSHLLDDSSIGKKAYIRPPPPAPPSSNANSSTLGFSPTGSNATEPPKVDPGASTITPIDPILEAVSVHLTTSFNMAFLSAQKHDLDGVVLELGHLIKKVLDVEVDESLRTKISVKKEKKRKQQRGRLEVTGRGKQERGGVIRRKTDVMMMEGVVAPGDADFDGEEGSEFGGGVYCSGDNEPGLFVSEDEDL